MKNQKPSLTSILVILFGLTVFIYPSFLLIDSVGKLFLLILISFGLLTIIGGIVLFYLNKYIVNKYITNKITRDDLFVCKKTERKKFIFTSLFIHGEE